MKIKTANIRFIKSATDSELKSVNVKEVFLYANELFFIHGETQFWVVSHFKTGMRIGGHSRTIALAKEDFSNSMKRYADHLSEAIDNALNKYGAANELPEGTK
jgi:hypothetical protein